MVKGEHSRKEPLEQLVTVIAIRNICTYEPATVPKFGNIYIRDRIENKYDTLTAWLMESCIL